MNVSILTPFPDLYGPFLSTSLLQRAQEKGLVSFDVVSMLSLCKPKERIDGPTYGHGPGMLIRPDVVERGVELQEKKFGDSFKIFFSPHGKKLDQVLLERLYNDVQERGGHCMLFPARYEGMDARVEEYYADEVVSLGDFVLMGGDIPAMALLEGLLRFVPDVVGRQESVEQDSFSGPFVDYPQYTAPSDWKGLVVPDVVRSGDHAALAVWREDQAIERTVVHHFDWLRSYPLTPEQRDKAAKRIPSHYVALMHDGIVLPDGREGTSSVTSIDIHDIARSAKTYGIKEYCVVTPLKDQQKIVTQLLDFWQKGEGVTYNKDRHQALCDTSLCDSLDTVIKRIEEREGVEPLVIATSARPVDLIENITYYDQGKVWNHRRPVLLLFGTSSGLAPSILQRCDYILAPVQGFSSFNHLSVRSAVAVVLDRWLGITSKYKEEIYS